MHRIIGLLLFCGSVLTAAELREETEVKFAFYSSAWGENTDDPLRLVALNQTPGPIRLDSIVFLKSSQDTGSVPVEIELELPAAGYADTQFDYIDLLQDNECIQRTLAENWKLVEISNYTLNPSVRNLIIEDTDSFRIYQCVENVVTSWTSLGGGRQHRYQEWVLFHFESRRAQ